MSDVRQEIQTDYLAFNPKWWWDPIPPWFAEFLTADIAKELMITQLKRQAEVIEIQQRSINETIGLIERMK